MDARTQQVVLMYSVLIPMCVLIPIPFMDDFVQNHLERRMVTEIAALHGRQLPPAEQKALVGHDRGGCTCLGCLVMIPLLPFKLIFRKILALLEWKGNIDLGSRMYVEGYLVDRLFAADLWPGDAKRAHEIIEKVVTRAGTSPVEGAFRTVWTGARQAVINGAANITRRLRKLVGQKEAVLTQALDQLAVDQGLVDKLKAEINKIHQDYFEKLDRYLSEELQPAEAKPEA